MAYTEFDITRKDELLSLHYCYITFEKSYKIHISNTREDSFHMSSSMDRRLFLSCLKCEGVRPVTFLNWAERCPTLL
jgi:hypothetical protein